MVGSTPSTGLQHPSFSEEGAGKRFSDCREGEWGGNGVMRNQDQYQWKRQAEEEKAEMRSNGAGVNRG